MSKLTAKLMEKWPQVLVAFAVIFAAAVIFTQPSKAADLGGNCCSDLEERIAELEATTARKGNRKMSLTVSGQISEALVDVWGDGRTSHVEVQSNTNRAAQSYLNFAGNALITPGYSAGFVLQIGTGGVTNAVVFPNSNGSDTNQIYVRESYLYLKSDGAGGLIIGKAEMATYDITGATAADTNVAHTKLSLAPLVGPTAGSSFDLFDGGIANVIKYKSPQFYGFWVEGSWANADTKTGGSNGSAWDAALKYRNDIGQFLVDARVGYRDGMVFDTSGSPGTASNYASLNATDFKVWAGSAGVRHMPTGLFVNGSFGLFDYSAFMGADKVKGWEVQAGIQERWSRLGDTVLFGNYGQVNFGNGGMSWPGDSFTMFVSPGKLTSYGLGVVQNVDAAAMQLYLTWTRYQDSDGMLVGYCPNFLDLQGNTDVLMGGATIKF